MKKKLDKNYWFWIPHLNTVATLPCKKQKSQISHLQQLIFSGPQHRSTSE